MSGTRRNDPCPCGSGKKYKNCCFQKNFIEVSPAEKAGQFTLDDGSKISQSITSIDATPKHNKNGIKPNITSEQMMDLCLDAVYKILKIQKVGMTKDLVDKVVLNMDIVPTFTYRIFSEKMFKDGRFEVIHGQICSLKGTDPTELMADKLKL